MNHFFESFLLVSFLFFTCYLSAQTSSIHAGSSFPFANFHDDYVNVFNKTSFNDEESNGAASTGFNLGYTFSYPIHTTNFNIITSLDLFYHGTNSNYKDNLNDPSGETEFYSKFPNYYIIPLTVGSNYLYKSDGKLTLFAEMGLTFDYLLMTDYTRKGTLKSMWSNNTKIYTQTTYSPSANIGFRIGGGFFIKNLFFIKMDYYNLGKHTIESNYRAIFYDVYDPVTDTQLAESSMQITQELLMGVSFLRIGVGMKF